VRTRAEPLDSLSSKPLSFTFAPFLFMDDAPPPPDDFGDDDDDDVEPPPLEPYVAGPPAQVHEAVDGAFLQDVMGVFFDTQEMLREAKSTMVEMKEVMDFLLANRSRLSRALPSPHVAGCEKSAPAPAPSPHAVRDIEDDLELDDEDADVFSSQASSSSSCSPTKKRKIWTVDEELALMEGVGISLPSGGRVSWQGILSSNVNEGNAKLQRFNANELREKHANVLKRKAKEGKQEIGSEDRVGK
jgi:hypothetical protein